MKIKVKVKTDNCGRCSEPHSGYTVKLDSKKVPYVVCGVTNKRVDVLLKDSTIEVATINQLANLLYATLWEIDVERSDLVDIKKLGVLLNTPKT